MFGRFVSHALRASIIVICVVRAGFTTGTAHADPAEAKRIFTTRCMACHTFGKGVKVGPDLKGVSERRERAWIIKFVRSSSVVIASGDKTASELFAQFNQLRMPDWTDLSEEQVGSILDWLTGNGPDVQDIDARTADSATLAEIENGRQLFHGDRVLTNGGAACTSCHGIRDSSGAIGGSLAADLTDVYANYQDGALAQFLKHPCFRRLPESANTVFLTPAEGFYIKSYLRQAVLDDRATGAPAAGSTVAKPVDPSGPPGKPPGGAAAAPAATTGATQRVAWTPKPSPATPAAQPPGARLEGALLYLALPYIALLILIIGLCVRYAMAQRQPDGGRAATTVAWQRFSGRLAWRLGLAVTVILHVIGLLLPSGVLAWNGVAMRLYLLEGSGLLFGALALVGWGQMMWRYLDRSNAGRAGLSEIADGILLSLFGLAVVSGLITAVAFRWGSSWAVGTLTPYMQSLATRTPSSALIEQLPFLPRLHTLLWFAVMAVIPFSSASIIIVTTVHRCLTVLGRPFDAMAESGRRVLAKANPSRWLWPEEDAVELVHERDNAQEPS